MPESKFLERGDEFNESWKQNRNNKLGVAASRMRIPVPGKTVSAAAEGKITGTVKLDGVAPT